MSPTGQVSEAPQVCHPQLVPRSVWEHYSGSFGLPSSSMLDSSPHSLFRGTKTLLCLLTKAKLPLVFAAAESDSSLHCASRRSTCQDRRKAPKSITSKHAAPTFESTNLSIVVQAQHHSCSGIDLDHSSAQESPLTRFTSSSHLHKLPGFLSAQCRQ